jgi:hypothetical protein
MEKEKWTALTISTLDVKQLAELSMLGYPLHYEIGDEVTVLILKGKHFRVPEFDNILWPKGFSIQCFSGVPDGKFPFIPTSENFLDINRNETP